MKVEGTYTFKASRDRVWHGLLTPDALAECIPGCQALQEVGKDKYEMTLRVGLGAISGTYGGSVTVTDKEAHSSFKMLVQGKGSGTTIRGEGLICLSDEEAGTVVKVKGDGQVTGGDRPGGPTTDGKRRQDNDGPVLQLYEDQGRVW